MAVLLCFFVFRALDGSSGRLLVPSKALDGFWRRLLVSSKALDGFWRRLLMPSKALDGSSRRPEGLFYEYGGVLADAVAL